MGAEEAFAGFTLLHDRQYSDAWREWFAAAGFRYPETEGKLIIPDPNVRVEAVVNNQGVALNDALVERELNSGRLYRLSDIELSDYGYYLVKSKTLHDSQVVELFSDWLEVVV